MHFELAPGEMVLFDNSLGHSSAENHGPDRRFLLLGEMLPTWAKPPKVRQPAMLMRGVENTVYFASVNYALRFPESATSLIGPSGECLAYLPYGQEGVLVREIDPEAATGLIASRYAPERYREDAAG